MTQEHSDTPFSSEMGNSPETIAQELVARIDRGLHELHVPPRDQRGWGWCNFVPDAVSYCAIQDGQENGYEVRTAIYQARDLHLAAAGKRSPRDIVSPDLSPEEYHSPKVQEVVSAYYNDPEVKQINETAFTHGFNVVEINGTPFLFDLSFSQFIGSEGMLIQVADQKSSGVPNDHPLAQQLLHNGFFPLNDENLRTYMRFLCTYEPNYLTQVTTDLLQRVPPLPFAVDDNELMDNIPPAYRGVEAQPPV